MVCQYDSSSLLFNYPDLSNTVFESIKFNKYKNNYGDLVDDAKGVVMHGSKVSTVFSQSICLNNSHTFNNPCAVYKIDNNIKYHLAKKVV